MINLHKLKEYSLLLVGREKKKKTRKKLRYPLPNDPFFTPQQKLSSRQRKM